MRQRTLGNTPTSVLNKLKELHSLEWLERLDRYMGAAESWLTFGEVILSDPPELPTLPNPRWLMSVYLADSMQRRKDTLATITTVTGTILKMDSTKKVNIY